MNTPKIIGVTKPQLLRTDLQCCICHRKLCSCDQNWSILVLASSNHDAQILINAFGFGAYHQKVFAPKHKKLVAGFGNALIWLLGKPYLLLVACRQSYQPFAQLAVDLEDLATNQGDSLMESIAYSRGNQLLLN